MHNILCMHIMHSAFWFKLRTPATGLIGWGVMGLARLSMPMTRHQAAVVQLRDAIVCGALAPGEHLKDLEIAAQLGLSSTPVREALVQLAAEGLVQIAT